MAPWQYGAVSLWDGARISGREADQQRQVGRFTQHDIQRATVIERIGVREPTHGVSLVHGVSPGWKQDGICRLIYENVNGLDIHHMDHPKIIKARKLHNNLEVDIVAYNEHRLNMQHKDNQIGFNQIFFGREADIKSTVVHNVHENIGHIQEGGTAVLAFGRLAQHADTSSGKNELGLGRWSVMTLRGEEGFVTRVVCGYNPCGNARPDSGTVYQQHRRFLITRRQSLVCPRVKFREDLIRQLTQWGDQGDRLIVCLDANEDIYKKSLGKALTALSGLGLTEVVGKFTGSPIGPTHFRGSKSIDGVWATSDVTVSSACIMPWGYGIGDHRLFVVDILTSSLIGTEPIRIVQPQARQ
jgi:hypothetical protein